MKSNMVTRVRGSKNDFVGLELVLFEEGRGNLISKENEVKDGMLRELGREDESEEEQRGGDEQRRKEGDEFEEIRKEEDEVGEIEEKS